MPDAPALGPATGPVTGTVTSTVTSAGAGTGVGLVDGVEAGTAAARGGRWQRLTSAHPLAVDTAAAAILALLTTAALLHQESGSSLGGVLIGYGLVLPLALRRRAPSAVFAVIAIVAFLQWAVDLRVNVDFPLLIALYTVAAHQPRRRALVAAGVLEVGVVLASVRFAPAGDVFGSLVFLSGLVVAAFFIGTTLRTRRAYLASVLDRSVRLERERDQQARLAATAERTRIAREMHDIVAHSLSVMVALADGATVANQRAPEQADLAMRQVSATGREALGEMRRLLGVLRDDDEEPSERTPQPDLAQLDDLLSRTREAGLPVRLTVSGAARRLPPTQQTVVFRLIQEGLTNVLKHGREVSDVRIRLGWEADRIEVDVTDDGQAGAPSDAGPTRGHGLAGMAERVAMFGGTVSAGPRAGGGWAVRARLPIGTAEDAR